MSSKKKKFDDEGASLFDTPTPLSLPILDASQLTSKVDFLSDTRYTLGMIAKISKQLTTKVADGESPNYYLSKYLTEISQVIKQSISSYNDLTKLESEATASESKVYIEFNTVNSVTKSI